MKEFAKAGWFKLTLPDRWQVDAEESPVAAYDPEGAGALQITAEAPRARKPGERIDVFLMMRAFLRSTGVEMDESASKRYTRNDLEWAHTEYEADSGEGPVFWRVWFATNHDVLAFLTYACRADDREAERACVDGVVDSLVLF
ncbi:MAG: hypothetical protein HYY17_15930 [Planctomycetes bacterium]|nr:hypothetical protein [Planctomycetota bacterium]